ncbi:MAG: hypothetical protein HFH68_02085 [Lachnospiraceae bacterium]|nr:hypothetical protein [Lachnospiraceae bacterium]
MVLLEREGKSSVYGLKQIIDGKTGVKIVRNVPEYNRVVDVEEWLYWGLNSCGWADAACYSTRLEVSILLLLNVISVSLAGLNFSSILLM